MNSYSYVSTHVLHANKQARRDNMELETTSDGILFLLPFPPQIIAAVIQRFWFSKKSEEDSLTQYSFFFLLQIKCSMDQNKLSFHQNIQLGTSKWTLASDIFIIYYSYWIYYYMHQKSVLGRLMVSWRSEASHWLQIRLITASFTGLQRRMVLRLLVMNLGSLWLHIHQLLKAWVLYLSFTF